GTAPIGTDTQAPPDQLESDQRVVAYWLVDGGGLACHDMPLTIAMRDGLPGTSEGNDKKYIIAPEVKSLKFSYYDGTSWEPSWDSTKLGADGMTPQGPPIAVA